MPSKELVFFTSNSGKALEAQLVFDPLGIHVSQYSYPFVEIQSHSLDEVLLNKVNQVRGKLSEPFLVDDSGFYVNAYPDFPGVMSKFVYETIGYEGVLKLLAGTDDRTAFFRASVALCLDDQIHMFEGISRGGVPVDIRGQTREGFLYEPIFVPNGSDLTMAEMSIETRQLYSYRAKALNNAAKVIGT